MEKLEYVIDITAPPKNVWDTMLNKDTYEQWVAKSWPNSSYEGAWEKGAKMKFTGPEGGGTLAEIVEVKPYARILARHVAILQRGGSEDRTSEMAQDWIGITEEYRFVEHNGRTTVTVIIETTPAWRKMFDDGWPAALQELKRLAEDKVAEV